jgi:hypothetical protein
MVPDPGMKIRKNTMTIDKTEIVRRHIEAATQMLLGNRTLKPGALIIAGELTGIEGRLALARLAETSGKDIVFLGFADTADGYGLTNISIVAARDGICHGQTDCQMYLPKTGARAVILPQPHVRGFFRLSPGELIHVDRKPADVEEGVARAAVRLATLVARGVHLEGRAVINTYPSPA